MNNDFDIEMNMNGINNEVNTQKYSNFAVAEAIIATVGQGLEMGGKIAEASARKKEAEAQITIIGGKRTAQNKACDEAKEYKKFFDPKYRKNRIADCKKEVKTRLDAEENEQRDIVRRMTAIEEGKIASEQRRADVDLTNKTGEIEEKKSSKKLYVIGGIVALVLVLGTVVYIKSKSN
jgi:hypothetical protein